MVAWLNRTLGGLGIAVFRLLYLRAQTFVLGCGERTLLWTIAATNAVIIVRYGMHNDAFATRTRFLVQGVFLLVRILGVYYILRPTMNR